MTQNIDTRRKRGEFYINADQVFFVERIKGEPPDLETATTNPNINNAS